VVYLAKAIANIRNIVRTAWWIFLLRGILFVLLGIMLLTKPIDATALIVLVFGIYLLVDGVFTTVFAIANHSKLDNWGLALLKGLASVLVGFMALYQPVLFTAVTVVTLMLIIGVSLIVFGVMDFIAMFEFKSWSMFFGGLLTTMLGVIFFLRPGMSVAFFISVTGGLMILGGMVMVAVAFKLERLAKKLTR